MDSDGFLRQLARRASVAGIEISPTLAKQLETYYRLLAHWNDRINLTAYPLDPLTDDATDRLLVEPLAARPLLSRASVWFDLGSGGGSPAIPLKLASPAVRLTMVESKARKAAFLKEAVRLLDISQAFVEIQRIEALRGSHQFSRSADVVTVRAVRLGPELFVAAGGLLRARGRLVLFGARSLQVPQGFKLGEDLTSPSSQLLVLVRTE
jgi:16S rRNA (guanine527-N7)-methyltransferase